jgi:hypothetical protein
MIKTIIYNNERIVKDLSINNHVELNVITHIDGRVIAYISHKDNQQVYETDGWDMNRLMPETAREIIEILTPLAEVTK